METANTDRMDKHDVYRMITFNRSCNVLKVNRSEKEQHIRCQTYAKREDRIEPKLNFNSQHPHHRFWHNGKCNICAFHEESHAFEEQVLCSSAWTTNRKMFCSLIHRLTSEGSDMLILPFTSKTGQSVAQNRQNFL